MKPITLTDAEARQLAETGEVELVRKVKPQPKPTSPPGWTPKDWPTGWWLWKTDLAYSTFELKFELPRHCPHGQPGDRLWVKEKWGPDLVTRYLKSAITMPRRASRSTVEILSVEVVGKDSVWWWRAKARRVEA